MRGMPMRASKGKNIVPALSVSVDVPSISLNQGESVQRAVTITPQNYSRSVSLSAASVPSGVTVTFSEPSPQSATVLTATMTIAADPGATPVSADAISVVATGFGVSGSVACAVTVVAVVSPAIVLTADDATVSAVQGSFAVINLSLARLGSHSADVTLTCPGLPTDVTATFSDSTLSGSESGSQLTINVGAGATPTGGVSISVVAASAGVSDSVVVGSLEVIASGGSPITFYRQSNWGQYADTAALIADQGVLSTGKTYAQPGELGVSGNGSVTIDPSMQPDGVPVARFRYHAGSSTKATIMANSKAQSDVWIRWRQRWTPGFCVKTPVAYTGGFAHKLSNFGFSGGPGRLLSSLTNCGGTPGAASGNNGDLVFEMMSKTNSITYVVPKLRSAISGLSSLFHDGEWYEFIVRWTRVDSSNIRAHIWFHKQGDTPNLLCTIRIKNLNHSAPFLKEMRFFDTWNASDVARGGGPPDPGVDQSIHLRSWEMVEEAVNSDPFGCGLTVGTGVTISGALTPDDTPAVVAGGASVQRTITVTRGSSLTGVQALLLGPADPSTSPPIALPTGLTVTYSAATLAVGVNTATVTIAASVACVPGTYVVNLFVKSGNEGSANNASHGLGAAVDCIPMTVTVT